MKIIPFPEYAEDVLRYEVPKDHNATVKHILETVTLISCDTETYYNHTLRAVSRFIQGNPQNKPFCLTLTYKEAGQYKSVYVDEAHIQLYKPILESESIDKILHNAKYDKHMLKNIGIDICGKIWDTMIMIHLIDEEHMCKTPKGTMVKSKALKDLAFHYLGEDGHKYEQLVDEVRRIIALRTDRAKTAVSYKEAGEAAPLIMKDYACSDTEFTYMLYERFHPEIINQELLTAYAVDWGATLAVFSQERVGIKIDLPYYIELKEVLKAEMKEITAEICTLISAGLNINSNRDMVKGFASLGLEWRWYTEKKEVKTSDEILEGITFNHGEDSDVGRLAALILQYRERGKLVNTFIAQLEAFIQWDGRIHPDFNIAPRDDNKGGTKTGRISSANPNLHNLPKDDKRIRKGIIPTEDYILVEFDYDQQEYRLLAHYAADRAFADIVHQGKDIHAGTAELLLHLTPEEAKLKKNRDVGKRLNFA